MEYYCFSPAAAGGSLGASHADGGRNASAGLVGSTPRAAMPRAPGARRASGSQRAGFLATSTARSPRMLDVRVSGARVAN